MKEQNKTVGLALKSIYKPKGFIKIKIILFLS